MQQLPYPGRDVVWRAAAELGKQLAKRMVATSTSSMVWIRIMRCMAVYTGPEDGGSTADKLCLTVSGLWSACLSYYERPAAL